MAGVPVIQSVRDKVERLIAENKRLKLAEQKTAARYERLRLQNSELSARIAELEMKLAAAELEQSAGRGSGDTKLARARINRLMREVDKCIALLSR